MSTLSCTPCKVSVSNLPSGGKMKWELKGMWPFILLGEEKKERSLYKESSELHVACGEEGGSIESRSKREVVRLFLFWWTNVSSDYMETMYFNHTWGRGIISGEQKAFFESQVFIWQLSANVCCISVLTPRHWDTVYLFYGEESMKGEWRGNLFSGTLFSLLFSSTLSEATVATTPWSYIQGVRYKELGGGIC